MEKALAAAGKNPDVKAATQQYYVHAVDLDSSLPGKLVSGDRKPARLWRGSQGITVRGEKPGALLALAGQMQDMGLVMNGLAYTLSPAKADEAQDSLMEGALAKLRTKAGRAAKALGKTEASLLEVNVDSGGYHPQPVMMHGAAMAKMDSMAAPVAAAGQTEITMTVSARALLK
jgi:predicted secreted protein